jgi:hypothetical protein
MAGADRRPWFCASCISPRREQPKRYLAQIALLSQPSGKVRGIIAGLNQQTESSEGLMSSGLALAAHTDKRATVNSDKAFFNGPPAPVFIGNA